MFITTSRRGYRGTEQYASGDFLMIFDNELEPRNARNERPLRALVRKVALHQAGHFMMGSVTLLGHRFSLSGTYGSDGLPMDVMHRVRAFERKVPYHVLSPKDRQAVVDIEPAIPYVTVPLVEGLWERLHPLPDELVHAFWSGGGHNSAGSEGPSLHEWAKTNLATLKHLRKVA